MEYRVERFDALQCTDKQIEELFSEGFPPFITADPVAHAYIERVFECFGKYNIALIDTTEDKLTASGWGVPIRWTEEVTDLPSGYTDALRRAIRESETKIQPNTLVICAGIVNPTLARKGLAGELIIALKGLAVASNLSHVIVPLRPTLKHRYPLTPIETYSQWVRPDGVGAGPLAKNAYSFGRQHYSNGSPFTDHDRNCRTVGSVDRSQLSFDWSLCYS